MQKRALKKRAVYSTPTIKTGAKKKKHYAYFCMQSKSSNTRRLGHRIKDGPVLVERNDRSTSKNDGSMHVAGSACRWRRGTKISTRGCRTLPPVSRLHAVPLPGGERSITIRCPTQRKSTNLVLVASFLHGKSKTSRARSFAFLITPAENKTANRTQTSTMPIHATQPVIHLSW
jgi:hypothetical protein